ncbi:HU family DNA-binding protein [Phocaeicola sp.]
MAVYFDFYETPDAPGTEKEEKDYHVRLVGNRTIETEELTKKIQKVCTLTKADVKAAMAALSSFLVEHLGAGERVHLEGVGYFQITLKCAETHNPKKTHSQNVHFKTVKFRPDQILLKELKEEIKLARADSNFQSNKLSEIEIDGKLMEFFQDNPYLTRARFERLCGFTRNMALKHLKRLENEKRLENTNTLHNPIYVPVKGNYGRSYSENK